MIFVSTRHQTGKILFKVLERDILALELHSFLVIIFRKESVGLQGIFVGVRNNELDFLQILFLLVVAFKGVIPVVLGEIALFMRIQIREKLLVKTFC